MGGTWLKGHWACPISADQATPSNNNESLMIICSMSLAYLFILRVVQENQC